MHIDKWLHITVSLFVTIVLWLIYNDLVNAMASTLAIGVMKELFDSLNGGNPDWHDLVADMVGIGVGYILIRMVS
jgi:VanZ family protein